MNKRPSLAESMRQAAVAPEPAPLRPEPTPPPAAPAEPPKLEPERRFYAATRAGKKKVTATLSPADHKRLRQLALDRETTTEALLGEAIQDLFAKYPRTGQ